MGHGEYHGATNKTGGQPFSQQQKWWMLQDRAHDDAKYKVVPPVVRLLETPLTTGIPTMTPTMWSPQDS